MRWPCYSNTFRDCTCPTIATCFVLDVGIDSMAFSFYFPLFAGETERHETAIKIYFLLVQ